MKPKQQTIDATSSLTSVIDTTDRFFSVVTPAYIEAENLPRLYLRLKTVMDALNVNWEWVIVDDHSPDGTFDVIQELSNRDSRVRGIRLARNTGAHMALTCGLRAARGDCAVALAADCQDPPEVIPALLEHWQAGAKVVWAAREKREGETAVTVALARVYYWLMRKIAGFKDMSKTGADFFLLDRRVLDAFLDFKETNVSILALITWMGFHQTTLTYTKEARSYGESGWTFRKKFKLLIDSITAFSYHPIRFMSYAGFVVALSGFGYAIVVLINAISGDPPQGWTTLTIIVLTLGGMQMLMMGVLGEYLWRTLDEARRRPQYIIEATTPNDTARPVKGLEL
jgi:dolichol-phosphate mannosyltransferase